MRQEVPYPRIRSLREANGWNQTQLAKQLNISQTCYSKYEIGASDIPVLTLIQLARIFDTSIDYLLGETDNPKRYD